MYIAGNLTSGDNVTTVLSLDPTKNQFTAIPGTNNLPGPVNALTVTNQVGDGFWAAGQGSDGTAYLQRYNGDQEWMPVDSALFGPGTDVRGIQVIQLSETHGSSDLVSDNEVQFTTLVPCRLPSSTASILSPSCLPPRVLMARPLMVACCRSLWRTLPSFLSKTVSHNL